jgi:sugar phosphate isomerase/epimerase
MHPRISVNSICFFNYSLQQQAGCWRSLDASRVSLAGPHIETEGLAQARAALATGDYRVETIVHPFTPAQRLDPDRSTWNEPRARLSAQISAAKALQAQSIYMTTGGHGKLTWEQAAETFAAAIAPCVEQARSEGIALMIENAPPQYADLHIAHNLRDTVTLAQMADIGVCIDLFSCWTEAGLRQTMERAAPLCQLVQVSDYVCGDRALPARAVPGDGDMPLPRLLDWILTAGYRGAFDLELLGPRIDGEGHLEATRRAATAVGEQLVALGA